MDSLILGICGLCFLPVSSSNSYVRCEKCPLKLHYGCCKRYEILFGQLKTTQRISANFTIVDWICLNCKRNPQIFLSECFLCGEKGGLLLDVESTQEAKNVHGICLINSGNFKYDKNLNKYIYSNFSNYEKRNLCVHCCKFNDNVECAKCKQFFTHYPCDNIKKSKRPNFCKLCDNQENFLMEEQITIKTSQKVLNDFFKLIGSKDSLKALEKGHFEENDTEFLIKLNNEEDEILKPELLLDIMKVKKLVFETDQSSLKNIYEMTNLKGNKIKSLSELRKRIDEHRYFTFNDFANDFFKLIWNLLLTNINSRGYLTNLIKQFFIERHKNDNCISQQFNKSRFHELKTFLNNNKLLNLKMECEKWPFIPQSFRYYQLVSEYLPIQNTYENKIYFEEQLTAFYEPVDCGSECCCWDIMKLGSFKYENMTWESDCPNRKLRIECNHKGKFCSNMGISSKKAKKLGEEVEETLCWGIDVYTRENIFYMLPLSDSELDKLNFVQHKLIKAMNFQKSHGYDMRRACEFILENSDESISFSKKDKKYARILLKALDLKAEEEAFRIHTKGQGLVCKKKEGIKQNEFIIEYFGEIYTPFQWYEKQDEIKKYMKQKNKKKVLLDFYNIMLETHKHDPKGYNLFFVDPIHKGNYSSRLSHSCDPNCGTVPTVANGQYYIGMFAMKDIEYGEELTFDYCSVTEDTNELKKAICLCGTKKCRGKYLELVKTKEFNALIDKYHGFLERNMIILRSSLENITKEDEEILEKFNLRGRVLENIPDWLKKWISLTLIFVDKEKDLLLTDLNEKIIEKDEQEIEKKKIHNKIIVLNNQESRIQNLIITIDKAKYLINKFNTKEPIFNLLTCENIFKILWGNKEENSIIKELINTLNQNPESKRVIKALKMISFFEKELQNFKNNFKKSLLLVRICFLKLSAILKNLKSSKFTSNTGLHKLVISDILYFYAFTHTYFTFSELNTVKGEKVIVRTCDVSNVETYIKEENNIEIESKVLFEQHRSYKGNVLWGQLVGWFKQTVVNPEASLSQDRRGTLSFPTFQGFFKGLNYEYPFQKKGNTNILKARHDFLIHLKEKPNYNWPPTAKWSYKNSQKCYGTILFENFNLKFMNKIDFLNEIIINIDKSEEIQFEFMSQIEEICEEFDKKNFWEIVKKINLKLKEEFKESPEKSINSRKKDENGIKREREKSQSLEHDKTLKKKRKKSSKNNKIEEN